MNKLNAVVIAEVLARKYIQRAAPRGNHRRNRGDYVERRRIAKTPAVGPRGTGQSVNERYRHRSCVAKSGQLACCCDVRDPRPGKLWPADNDCVLPN